jgi:hypothetical protein
MGMKGLTCTTTSSVTNPFPHAKHRNRVLVLFAEAPRNNSVKSQDTNGLVASRRHTCSDTHLGIVKGTTNLAFNWLAGCHCNPFSHKRTNLSFESRTHVDSHVKDIEVVIADRVED